MISTQQQQTLAFFEANAAAWQARAKASSEQAVNTLQQRYGYVWHVAGSAGPFARALDLGCGAGDAIWPMARRGMQCLGVDFAPSMIEFARRGAKEHSLSNCEFAVGSVLEYPLKSRHFDLAFALGVIEYLSLKEVEQLLWRVWDAMVPDGSLVLESRNRLFNLVSFNDFTVQEIETGNLAALLEEALAIVSAPTMSECLEALVQLKNTPDVLETYPAVGVPVQIRHQYTPGQLSRLLSSCGFQPAALSGYHYHGLTPRLMRELPKMHATIAREIQGDIVERHEALTNCSSYMIHAKRR
jgi:2-polyprenyl-3-methyl-5-hydroxy-6-metoxy-1,4-benzoquinol methylase